MIDGFDKSIALYAIGDTWLEVRVGSQYLMRVPLDSVVPGQLFGPDIQLPVQRTPNDRYVVAALTVEEWEMIKRER